MEIHEKGTSDVVSAVCYAIYIIYLSLRTQTAETTNPEPFREFLWSSIFALDNIFY